MDSFFTWLAAEFVALCHWCTGVMDPVLGWLLTVPYDFAILFVGIGTSVLLTIGRRLTTNQDLLRRCKNDMTRLTQLRKQAKKNKDKIAIGRIALTVGHLQIIKMKAEMKGLAAAIIPILFLASWAFDRLDFVPPKVDEVFSVRATFPVSACNNLATLVVEPAGKVQLVRREDGSYVPDPESKTCIREIRKDDNVDPETGVKIPTDVDNGLADWYLKVQAPCDAVKLRISYKDKAIEHVVKVGGVQYGDPILTHDESKPPWQQCSSSLQMRRALFLSWVPGADAFWKWWLRTSLWNPPDRAPGFLGFVKLVFSKDFVFYLLWLVSRVTMFAPWLAAYLIITIPFVPGLRRLTRMY